MKNELLNIDFDTYCNINAVHKSTLTEIEVSPAHYKWACENPKPPTSSQEFGSLFHTIILEPSEVESRYMILEDSPRRGTKAWELIEMKAQGRTIIKQDDWQIAKAMHDSIRAHSRAAQVLVHCDEREVSALWTDLATGEQCKGRLDALSQNDCIVADLKTCQCASPLEFERAVINYKYHWQAAFYLDGLKTITGKDHTFVFIAVEKEPPYGVAVYTLSDEFVELGRSQYKAALGKVAECRAKRFWPCYSDSVLQLAGPEWLHRAKQQ